MNCQGTWLRTTHHQETDPVNAPSLAVMSMSQRLSKLYQEVTVKGEDLSHLTLEELSAEKIKFGEKHQGATMEHVWRTDPEWIRFMVNRYETSVKPEHQRLMKFVELKLKYHEENQLPVRVPKARSTAAPMTSRRQPKCKAAPRTPIEVDEAEISDLQLVESDATWENMSHRDVQPGDYAPDGSEPAACGGVSSSADAHAQYGECPEPSDPTLGGSGERLHPGELMCQDELQISEEEEVYEAILTWIRHDLVSRECFFPDLLRCLRLFSMSKYSLRSILDKEELVTKNPVCTNILTKGLDFFLFPDQFLGMSLKHRTSIEREEHVVILTGGVDLDMVLSRDIWCLVLATKKWHRLTRIPSSLLNDEYIDLRCVSAVCGGQLFLLPDNSASISCFNPQTGRWKSVNIGLPIDLSRTLTSFNENLYVIGGEKYPHTVVKYSPIRNKLKKLPSMEAGRAGHCAVPLGDLIYMITGFRDQVCLQSAESYNPLTNQWVKIPDLAKARRFASAVATCGKILVFGGFCDTADTNDVEFTCEVFDPCVNQWSLVASPAVPRAACAIASVDETVYLFGGENEERLLDDVEMLDVKSNEWHQISCTLPKPLSYAQASLLKLPKKLLKQS